jgi:hypothetical protein
MQYYRPFRRPELAAYGCYQARHLAPHRLCPTRRANMLRQVPSAGSLGPDSRNGARPKGEYNFFV